MAQYLILPVFKNQVRIIARRLKCKHIKEDILEALNNFIRLSTQQKTSLSIGHHEYKIRVGSKDLKKGKRSAFRVIIILANSTKELFIPYAFYYKDDFDELPQQIKNVLLSQMKEELAEWN